MNTTCDDLVNKHTHFRFKWKKPNDTRLANEVPNLHWNREGFSLSPRRVKAENRASGHQGHERAPG